MAMPGVVPGASNPALPNEIPVGTLLDPVKPQEQAAAAQAAAMATAQAQAVQAQATGAIPVAGTPGGIMPVA